MNPLELSRHFCDEYNIDMSDLLCERPTKEPRVSDHIDQIKDMITQVLLFHFGCLLLLLFENLEELPK